jgi:hypothetical protein
LNGANTLGFDLLGASLFYSDKSGQRRFLQVFSIRAAVALCLPFVSEVWQETSPVTILSIGQGIQDAGYDPVWRAATRSASPAFLFDKWRRFEAFAHSQNRV